MGERVAARPMTMRAAALLMAASVLLSRVIGLLREQYVAWRFGASGETDVYLAAFTLPDLLSYLLAGGSLSITFVPLFTKYLAEGKEDEGWRVFSVVMTFLALAMGLGVLAGSLVAEPALGAYFSTLPPERLPALVRMTWIVFPSQIFHVLGAIITATLMARGSFRSAALAPILYNLGIIAGGVFLSGPLGIEGMAWGVLVGSFVGPFLVPLLDARRGKLRYSISLDLRHPGFRAFLWIALPLMLGASLVTVDEWIARRIAAGDEGAITHLNYARKLLLVPVGFLAQAGGVASYPFFARLLAERKLDELADAVVKATRAVLVLSIVAAGAVLPVAGPLVTLLFERGGFRAEDSAAVAPLLVWYLLGLPAWGLQAIWARGCYAAGDTWRPMLLSTVVVVASYPLFAALYGLLGAPGLSLASTIGISAQAVFLWPLLRRHAPALRAAPIVDGALRALVVAGVAGGAVYGLGRLVTPGALGAGALGLLLWLGGAGLVFAGVALAGARLLRLSELDELRQKVLRRLRRR